MKLVKLKDITHNQDGRRIPLNECQRNQKKNNPQYPYYGANKLIDYIDEYIFDEKILCLAEDGGAWGKNQKCSFIVTQIGRAHV